MPLVPTAGSGAYFGQTGTLAPQYSRRLAKPLRERLWLLGLHPKACLRDTSLTVRRIERSRACVPVILSGKLSAASRSISEFGQKRTSIFHAERANLFPADEAQINFLDSFLVHMGIELGHRHAGGPDWQRVFPPAFHVSVALVEFLGENQILLRVVDAERGDGITLQAASGCCHANIRAIKMEVRQIWVKPQPGGFLQDQYDFVQSLDRCGPIQGFPHDTQAAGVYISAAVVVERLSVATQNSPLWVCLLHRIERALQIQQPKLGEYHVLMRENDQIVGTSIDCVVVGSRCRSKTLLNKNLMGMRPAEARRCQKITLEDALIIDSRNKRNGLRIHHF